ncbi:MAG: 16S rRNA (cytosine(1402)-N(4))-methyltransferase RsmH [Actinomycetota bacterium]|nr:16S rRNA (cytosine(1402)-N(4))-methyltransferase RsmH [Actinomycetota bacterium]
MNGPAHVPVLAHEVTALLVQKGSRTIVDATLGAAGHAETLLEAMGEHGKLLGIDRDPDAIATAQERLKRFGSNVKLVQGNFADVEEIVGASGWGPVDGVLFDLGVSSMHFDRPERGFSYQNNAPLDMRMDPAQPVTAADVVNTYDERDLTRIIREYGEERWAARIAKFIVASRKKRRIQTTYDLVEVIRAAVPAAARRGGPHPARRTFQALRIEVNGELEALEASLPQAVASLAEGGRVAAISYHSLEDRRVKRTFASLATGEAPRLRVLTRKPIRPSEDEIARNPRASAAKLRAAERLAAPHTPTLPPSGSAA